MWSACSPSTPTIRFRIPLRSKIFCKIVIEKNENTQKEAGVGPFKKKNKNDLNSLNLRPFPASFSVLLSILDT